MKFILGILTGIVAALIFNEGYHLEVWRHLDSGWQTIQASNTGIQKKVDGDLQVSRNAGLTPTRIVDPAATAEHPATVPQPLMNLDSIPPAVVPESEPAPSIEMTDAQLETLESFPPGPTLSSTAGTHNAWTSFRSHTSASGFAEKLARELQRDFITVKVAPGHYEVRFQYDSLVERDATLDSIETLTGYRVEGNS